MKQRIHTLLIASLGAVLGLAGCSKANEVDASTTHVVVTNQVSKVVGPEGARVEIPDRARVDIPPGALPGNVTISISQIEQQQHPALPASFSQASPVYAFEPHDQQFLKDVQLAVFHDQPGLHRRMLTAAPLGAWSEVQADATNSSFVQTPTAHFSLYVTVEGDDSPPLGDSGAADSGHEDAGDSGEQADAQIDAPVPDADAAPPCEAIDIIVAVDSSGSMQEESNFVAHALPDLMQGLEAFDPHLVVFFPKQASGGVAADLCPPGSGDGSCSPNDDASQPNVCCQIDGPVSESYALQRLLDRYADYEAMLRDNARTYVIIVADEISLMAASDFHEAFRALAPARASYVFSGLVPVAGTCESPGVDASAVPPVYHDLASWTGGALIDICSMSEWEKFVPSIAGIVNLNATEPCH